MLLFVTSFLAGVLTILAPCILPLLPIIVGGSVGQKNLRPALRLIGALSISVVLFTLLLRASTVLISVPATFWTTVSGGLLIGLGLITVWPDLWEKVSLRWNNSSKQGLQKAGAVHGWKRELLMGFALGPVFTSCSPTYALILATILPASYVQGVFYTLVYALGLAVALFLIALLGQRLTTRLHKVADPKGWVKRSLGVLFLLVGLFIVFGWDKQVEAWIIDQGYFGVTEFEENLVEQLR
jgi:cytochrome c biogenesis protein CcdA